MKQQYHQLIIAILMAIFATGHSFAQVTDGEKQIRGITPSGENGWKTVNNISIALSQVSLTNWAAGGQNSLAINGRFNGLYGYQKDRFLWDNQVDVGYGLLKQGKYDWQKTDDRIELLSKAGYKITNALSAAALATFKTQFAPGYHSPDAETRISDFLSPGYLLGAVGLDYKKVEWFSLFVSPLTAKMTFVMDDSLAAAGSFGAAEGKKFRAELGGYIRAAFKHDLMTNVSLATNLDFFSNYLKDPHRIDVNWEALILMKINKFLTASINTHLLYDYDIKIGKDTTGDGELDDFRPRVQFKELVGIGLTFTIPTK